MAFAYQSWFPPLEILSHLVFYAQQMSGKALRNIQDLIPQTPLKKGGLKIPPLFKGGQGGILTVSSLNTKLCFRSSLGKLLIDRERGAGLA